MKFRIIVSVLICSASCRAALIAGWDFQVIDNLGFPSYNQSAPDLIASNSGDGSMYLNGAYGSSKVNQDLMSIFIDGSEVNADADAVSINPTEMAVGFMTFNSPANVVFSFNSDGFRNLRISYAMDLTWFNYLDQQPSGALSHGWDYSVDGAHWTSIVSFSAMSTSFERESIEGIAGLDNVSTAFLRLNIGASGTGMVAIDNIRFEASAIPETDAVLALAALFGGCAFYRRRA